MQTGQHGYGLAQSRLSAATAAGRFLEENKLNKEKQQKPATNEAEWEGESSPSSRAVKDDAEGLSDRTDRSA